MKKNALIILVIGFTQLIFAQNQNFIEVAVNETIELKAKSVEIEVIVIDEYSQRESRLYNYFEDEYYYDSEEDYYYEEMIAESPKKVTKEMKEAYEQRQREREEWQAEQDRREAEFQPYKITDLMKLLDDHSISYSVVSRRHSESIYEPNSDATDSILSVILTSKEKYDQFFSLISTEQVYTDHEKVVYEEIEDHYETVIPKITEKANKQANLLASSMQRKLGKVIQCTNVLPTGVSPRVLNQIYNGRTSLFSSDNDYNLSPFSAGQTSFITFIYRFELL